MRARLAFRLRLVPHADGRLVSAARTTGTHERPMSRARVPRRQDVAFHHPALSPERKCFRRCRCCKSDPASLAELGRNAASGRRAIRQGVGRKRTLGDRGLGASSSGSRLDKRDRERRHDLGLLRTSDQRRAAGKVMGSRRQVAAIDPSDMTPVARTIQPGGGVFAQVGAALLVFPVESEALPALPS